MRFFLDNCISFRLAPALDALSEIDGHQVAALRSRFPEAMRDEDWLMALAAEGDWVVISGDFRIYKNPQRRLVWKRCRLTSFFWQPAWNKNQYWEIAWRMVRWWPKITRTASYVERGSAFSIPFSTTGKLRPL